MAEAILASSATSKRNTIIYGLCDPRTGDLRYVGKTSSCLRKRIVAHIAAARSGRSKWRSAYWIKSILDLGMEPEVFEIEVVSAGEDWQEAEVFWIAMFRALGANLTNITTGGEGASGHIPSDEVRAKLSAARRGRPLSESHKKSLSKSRKGMKFSPSHLAAMSRARKGIPSPTKGRAMSEETKEKLRQRALEQWSDPKAIEHISQVRKGRKTPEATKAILGQQSKQRWADAAYKEKLSRIQRVAQQGKAEEAKLRMKQKWADPEFREKMLADRARAKEARKKAA